MTTTTETTQVTRKKVLPKRSPPDPEHLTAPKNYYEQESNDKYRYSDDKVSTQNMVNMGTGSDATFLAYIGVGTEGAG